MAADKQIFSDPQQLTDHIRDCFRQAIKDAPSAQVLKERTGSGAFAQSIITTFYEKYDLPPMADDFKPDALAAEQQANTNGKGATYAINYLSNQQFKKLKKDFNKYHAFLASPPSKAKHENNMMAILDVAGITPALAQRFVPNAINKINVSLQQHDAGGKLPSDLARMLNLEYATNLLMFQGQNATPESNPEEFKKYTQQAYAVYDVAPILITMPQRVYAIIGESETVPPGAAHPLHDMARTRHLEMKKWLDKAVAKAAFSEQVLQSRKELNDQALQRVSQFISARTDSFTISKSPSLQAASNSNQKESPLNPGSASPSEVFLPPSVKWSENLTKTHKRETSMPSPLRFNLAPEENESKTSPLIRRGTPLSSIQAREGNIPSPVRLNSSHKKEGSSSPTPNRRGTSFTSLQERISNSPTLPSIAEEGSIPTPPSIKRGDRLEQAMDYSKSPHVDQLVKSREENRPDHSPLV